MSSGHFATYGVMVLILAMVLWRRTRATRKPVRGNGWRILVPLVFLLFAFPMWADPAYRPSAVEVIVAAAIGLCFSVPLILTTNYEIREDGLIYARQSRAFIIFLVVLIAIRMILAHTLHVMSPLAMTTCLVVVAACYLIPWRIVSFVKYRRVRGTLLS